MPVPLHGNHYFGLKGDLEAVFGRRVDLLESDAVTNPYFLRASSPSGCCSMQRDAHVYLHDVLTACKTVTGFVEGKTFDDYAAHLLLRSAVERQLSIVGEALNQALKADPGLAAKITAARQIVDFRNLLIDAYTTVSAPVVWTVLEVHLPVPTAEVRVLLAELGSD